TRLLAALRAEAQLAGVTTVAARGDGLEALPYAALRPWLLALADRRGPAFERLAPLVARIVPEVGVAPAPALEGAQERLRANDALAALAVDAFPGPTLWLLDDADRLEPAGLEVVAALRRAAAGRPWTFALAGAVAGEAHPLPLLAFDDESLAQLAGYLLGTAPADLPAEVLERLPTLADGRPGLAEAALAHWVREGSLVREGGRWMAAPDARFEAPGDLAAALVARIATLGEDARTIALAAARLGQPPSLEWLAATLDLDEAAFFAGLAALRAAGALVAEGDRFRFERPAVAEALAASWDAEAARRFHGRAYRELAARLGDPRPADDLPLDGLLALARHGLAGDEPLGAVPWAIAAARRATGLHAVGPADQLVGAALALDGLADEDRAALLALQGYVRRFQGRVDDALALYEAELLPLLRRSPGPELVEHLVTWGVLLQLKGRYDEALAAHAEAINLADGCHADRQAVRARLFAGRVGVFAGHGRMARTTLTAAVRRARALVATTQAEPDAMRSLLARALSILGYLEGTSGDPERVRAGLAMLDEAVAIDQAIGDLRETHEALNNLGNVYQAQGRYREAGEVFAECLTLCERMASPNEAIFAHINLGAALLELGRPREAARHAREAAQAAGAQGRKFPEGCALAIEGPALVRLGEPGRGLARLDEALASAEALGNKYLALMVQAYRATALLDVGAWEAAADAVAAGRALATETANQEYDAKLVRVELALAALTAAPDAEARITAAVATGRAGGGQGPLAHALRWLAALHAGRDESDAALRAAEQALALAEALGLARLEAELHGLMAIAAVGAGKSEQAGDHARRALARAAAAEDPLGEATWAAAVARRKGDARAGRDALQRLEAIAQDLPDALREDFWRDPSRQAARDQAPAGEGLGAGRVRLLTALIAAMADATDLDSVMDQALSGLIELAGAERGFLVLYDGFEERERLALTAPGHEGEADDGFSTGLAQQVLWTGEPLFVEDASAHAALAANASVQALALRSVLGLPLRAGGETIGVMIADSRTIGRGLDEAELALALALAQAVALAITHARKHAAAARALAVAEAVRGLALATAGVTDPVAYAQAALAAALAASGAERGLVLLGPADALETLAARDANGPLAADGRPGVSASVCGWVLEQGAPMHMVDVQSEEAFQSARSVMALGLRTIWAVPLGGAGLIYLDSQRLGDDGANGLEAVTALAELTAAFLTTVK
ncbi:MAG: protein kinase, partial [Cyanobacteria bacterium RYN_339]|nr:protein kinase [Cyanobacteria bacterium RYN_339]